MRRIERDFPPSGQPAAGRKHSVRRALQATAIAGLALAALTLSAQLGPPQAPAGNPVTPAKARLGKVLFWDEQLSSTGTVSCGTCHIPAAGGNDPRTLTSPLALHPGVDGIYGTSDDVLGSPGVPLANGAGDYLLSSHFGLTEQTTGRRTVPSVNAGYSRKLFWDGRAGEEFVDPVTSQVILSDDAALETQAMGPPTNDVEMGNQGRAWTDVLGRLSASEPLALASHAPTGLIQWVNNRTYAQLFTEAFGTADITAARVGMAIATYERTLFTNQTPFDESLIGEPALTEQEELGRIVFSNSSCDRCHVGVLMSDNNFHYIGLRPSADDLGLYAIDSSLESNRGKMRTPSLRNVELRAPFMSDGSLATLEEVIDFYDRGGDFNEPQKDPQVRPLGLTTEEKAALLAFLKRPLTDRRLAEERPPFDRPHLFTESSRVPVLSGTGVNGSGGLLPMAVALEPALIGNTNFTVGIQNALGGASARLVIDDADPGLTLPSSGELAFENIVLQGSGAGGGFGSVNLTIPNQLALVDRTFYGRWYITDPGAPSALAVSRLFRFKVFRPFGQSVLYVDDFETGNTSRWSAASP